MDERTRRLIEAYAQNDLKRFYGAIEKFTPLEINVLAEAFDDLSTELRRFYKNYTDALNYPADNEE